MQHLFEPVARPVAAGRFHRGPAVPVVFAVMLGVLIDRLSPLSLSTWLLVTACALFTGAMRFALRRRSASAALLLLSWASFGAAWHHWRWSCLAENDLSAWATDGGQLARLTAKVLQAPLILKNPDAAHTPWRAAERTMTVIECRALVSDTAPPQPVSGLARLMIEGRFDELSIGDVIEITGELVRPPTPANPGDFDSRGLLRTQGCIASSLPSRSKPCEL
ncbi:MAG: DUF4131 domain-containing protein [Candidatus Saccharimonas sp.]|nr:DUF4131 domain-containing protein [Planctomycetaceae bacterium]